MRRYFFAFFLVLSVVISGCTVNGGSGYLIMPETPVVYPTPEPVITETPRSTPEVTDTPVAKIQATKTALPITVVACQVNVGALNIRSGPGMHHSVVGWLFLGQRIELAGTFDGDWAAISGGWINTLYCDKETK